MLIDPRWRTSSVIDLCRSMRVDDDYSRLAILADALEDAGCDESSLIESCRSPNLPYVLRQKLVAIVLSDDLGKAVRRIEEYASTFLDWDEESDVKSVPMLDYVRLVEIAGDYLKTGQEHCFGFVPDEESYQGREQFWRDYAEVTGKGKPDDEYFFRCAC